MPRREERLVSDEQILAVIAKHKSESLTVRRLMELLGYYSTSTVHDRMKRLEKQGLIAVRQVRMTVIEVRK